jgi:hypothetical protein
MKERLDVEILTVLQVFKAREYENMVRVREYRGGEKNRSRYFDGFRRSQPPPPPPNKEEWFLESR